MTQLETNVLNDKTKSAVAERNLAFYYPFLAAIGKETVEGKIIPQIQFIMNRTKQFVRVIALILQGFKAYKIEDLPTLKVWTTELLSEEVYLEGSGSLGEDVVLYMKAVYCMCSETHNMKQALIMDVLVDKFK